jgi:hypothetical protein
MGTVLLFGTAVPVIELVLGVVMLLVILGMATGATLLFFFGQAAIDKVKYPVKVPGWKMRMAEPPPFNATPADVGRMNQLLLKHAVAKGYKKREVKKVLNNSLVRWVKADPGLDGKRAVVDPYGRTVKDKETGEVKPMLIAGWHTGHILFVVFVVKDVIEKTAYAHEVGHGLHTIKGKSDYDHVDGEMFGKDGIVALAKNEMHKERTGEDPVEPLDDGIEVKDV